jgi:hypothetical protein
MSPRIALIGDVQGYAHRLEVALRNLGADPACGTLPEDLTVVQLGDLVHKGPDSTGCIAIVDRQLRVHPAIGLGRPCRRTGRSTSRSPGDQAALGAFHDTSLDAYPQEHGVTQVVLAGIATSVGVESTARSAYEHGYHVVLATDAMTDRDPDAHQNSIERIFPKLGETASTAQILDLLDRTR